MSERAISYEIQSATASAGNKAQIKVDGAIVPMPNDYGRGFNVAVVDETSGAVVEAHVYDICGTPTSADEFASLIERIPAGRIICIAVKDKAATNLTDRAKRACRMIGSCLIENLTDSSSFAIVGKRGAPPGAAVEQLAKGAATAVSVEIPLQNANTSGIQISARAAGAGATGCASIAVNGEEVPIPGGYRSGLNVVVMDETTAEVLQSLHYDTCTSSAEADAFATMITALPVQRLVAISALGDAGAKLTDDAKAACEALGSTLVHNLTMGTSWSLVGFKGAVPGTVAESLSTSTPVYSVYWHFPEIEGATQGFPCALQSSGSQSGSKACVVVGQYPALSFLPSDGSTRRGLNVVVISESTGELMDFQHYDTHASEADADAFAALVDRTPLGRFVAVAVQEDAAAHLTERAKRACEMLGSGLIRNLQAGGSWVMIGRKGCAPGSVPEVLVNDAAVSVEAWLTIDRPRFVRPFIGLRADSAGFNAAGATSIQVVPNFRLIQLTSGYGRGLNVVVIDEQSGEALDADTYDTHLDGSTSDRFAAMIEGLSAGRVVVIAAKDDAAKHLTERAKKACESLGSAKIRQLDVGGSWAFIGRKGATSTAIAEALSSSTSASCCYWLFPKSHYSGSGFNVSARSAGTLAGEYAQLLSQGNEIPIPGCYRRGVNVAVLDETNGNVLQAASYDTSASAGQADELAALIESVPAGRIVAIAVKDDASANLTERAKRACEALGSGRIRSLPRDGSWALVGVKGTAPGSALEQVDSDGPTAVSTWIPFPPAPAARAFPIILPSLAALMGVVVAQVVIFGYYAWRQSDPNAPPPPPPPPIYERDMAKWLKDVPDTQPICAISLPGTHDSAAIRPGLFDPWACHETNLTDQLNAGIRLLDIRLKVNMANGAYVFVTCHGGPIWGIRWNEYQSLESALNECKQFLQSNPEEFIAILLKVDDWNAAKTDAEKMAAGQALAALLGNYPIHGGSAMPKLQEVRGKLYVLSRIAELSVGIRVSWTHNTPGMWAPANRARREFNVYVQDKCEALASDDEKLLHYKDAIRTWGSSASSAVLLNFASAVKGIQGLMGVYIHEQIVSYIGAERPPALGWSLFDFEDMSYPTDLYGLVRCVELIVACNFGYQVDKPMAACTAAHQPYTALFRVIRDPMQIGVPMSRITLYKDGNYKSTSLVCAESLDNLKNYGFNDCASSCIVDDGTWLLYGDANFQGSVSILGPGKYPHSSDMGLGNDSLSSLRPLPEPDSPGKPAISMFVDGGYHGRMVSLFEAVSNFKNINLNDAVSSIIVTSGIWELFKDADFGGTSWVVRADGGPNKDGRYPHSSDFGSNDAISSARPK